VNARRRAGCPRRSGRRTSSAVSTPIFSGSPSRAAKGVTPSGARGRPGPPATSASSSASCGGKVAPRLPEGRPSPDGELGPLRRGLDASSAAGSPSGSCRHARLRPARPRAHRVVLVFGARFLRPPKGSRKRPRAAEEDHGADGGPVRRARAREGASRIRRARRRARVVARARQARRPRARRPCRRAAKLAEARRVAEEKPEEIPFLATEFESARS
jgi:hypothetical protein